MKRDDYIKPYNFICSCGLCYRTMEGLEAHHLMLIVNPTTVHVSVR